MPFKISGEDRMLEGILLVGGVTIFALGILFDAGTVDDRDTNELLGSTVWLFKVGVWGVAIV